MSRTRKTLEPPPCRAGATGSGRYRAPGARALALAALLAGIACIAGCQAERVDASAVRPHASLAAALPMPGTLHVRIARATREQRTFAQYSRVTSQTYHVGREVEDAALLVARRYFRDVAALTPESRTHYVLSIDASANATGVLANNEVGLLATLYANDGHVLYREVTTAQTPPFGDVDRETYFNAYVQAVQRFLDDAVRAKRGEMELDLASRPPGPLAFEYREGETPARVEFSGTGTRVSEGGVVATARHVAQDCLGLVRVDGRKLQPLYVLASNPVTGVLLLDPSRGPGGHVTVGRDATMPSVGTRVTLLDIERTARTDAAARWIEASVRAPSRTEDNPQRLLLDVPLPPGSRGGPVFDAGGAFLGIALNSADIAADAGPSAKPTARLHAAIPAAAVRQVLDAAPLPPGPTDPAGAPAAPISADANAAAVFPIACVE